MQYWYIDGFQNENLHVLIYIGVAQSQKTFKLYLCIYTVYSFICIRGVKWSFLGKGAVLPTTICTESFPQNDHH